MEEAFCTLAGQDLDWGQVHKLALHHQTLQVLNHHLQKRGLYPDEHYMREFKRYARGSALQSMLLVEQLKVLDRELQQAGLQVIHFKGPVLAMQAYKSLSLRVCSDLDMLLRPDDLLRFGGVVTENGFIPGSKMQRWYGYKRRLFLYLSKQATFVHRHNHIHLDVHIALAPPLYAYPTHFDALYARSVLIEVQGVSVRTFSPEDALVLLCLHGEKNRWEFLKYVCDIAALIEAHPALDWQSIAQRSEHTHTRRIVLIGMSLAHALLGAEVPARMLEPLEQEPAVRELRDYLLKRFSSMNMKITDFEKRFWLHLRAQDSIGDRIRYLGVATLRWAWEKRTNEHQ